MFGCDCQTDKVDIPPEHDELENEIRLLEVCCTGLKDIYTDESEDEEELINKTII